MFSELRFFFDTLAVGTNSGTLKAALEDWDGDAQSIVIDGFVKSNFQVEGHIQPSFFLPLRSLETETL